ncbi:putative NTF2-like domain superfamily protein [Helianthus annuus]|nr:putative NTF2-like domain superfamily protein [Helianthus annuus]
MANTRQLLPASSSSSSYVTVVHNHRRFFLSNGTRIRCSRGGKGPENLLLKTAWYGSELLGIAASFFRPSPPPVVEGRSREDVVIERAVLVETIKGDYQRSYFVTGALTLDAYEDHCEFADPAGSFKGLLRFKRNCTNFGSLIHKSNMNLIKWEDFQDKGIAHWRFSCTMAFPWRPILSATGYTEYYLSKESGRVCRHVEHWNVPKMALFKQLLKPSRQGN